MQTGTYRNIRTGLKSYVGWLPTNNEGVYVTPECRRIPVEQFEKEYVLIEETKQKSSGYTHDIQVKIWKL